MKTAPVNPSTVSEYSPERTRSGRTNGANASDHEVQMGVSGEERDRSLKAKDAAKKFESYFVGFVFQKAYESIPKSDLLGGSQEQLFTGMFIENVAGQIANSPHGLGLADQIYRQMNSIKDEKSLSSDSNPPLQNALGRDGFQVSPESELGLDFAQSGLGALKGIK